MADDPFAGLSQAERDYLTGKGLKDQPAVAPSAPATRAPVAAAPAAPAAAAAPASAPAPAVFGSVTAGMPVGGAIDAFNLGATQGMGTVANAPSYLGGQLGFVTPRTVDTSLTPEQQAGMTAHPWAASIGRTAGQILGTAPAMIALPETLGAAGLATGARIAANPLVQGAVTNLLTGAESPDESLLHRAGMGAAFGWLGGKIGGKIGSWFGADAAIPQSSQEAGQLLQNAGIDLTEHNIPGATGGFVSTKTMGAPPTEQQAAQIAQAVTSRFGPAGQGMTDLGSNNLNTLLNDVGNRISTAANSGGIDIAKATGLAGDLQGVIAASQDPVNMLTQAEQRAIAAQTGRVINAINAGGGKLSGSQFDSLVGSKSQISNWINPSGRSTQSDGMTNAAGQLDEALRNAFQTSSPADAYGNWVNARTDYRLLKGIENSVDANGELNPTTLWANIKDKFRDLRTLTPSSANQVAEMGQLAAALRTAFGGAPPNISQAQAGGTIGQWIQQHPLATVATGGAALNAPGIFNMLANPAQTLGAGSAYALSHLPVVGAAAPLAAAGVAARWLGQRWQQSANYLPNLLRTGQGTMPLVNALVPAAPSVMTVLPPSPQSAPPR